MVSPMAAFSVLNCLDLSSNVGSCRWARNMRIKTGSAARHQGQHVHAFAAGRLQVDHGQDQVDNFEHRARKEVEAH